MDNGIAFRKHLSQSLLWKWHLQDFAVRHVQRDAPASFIVTFRPRFGLLHRAVTVFYAQNEFPVTTVSSVRLAFMASIVAAGIELGKIKKDGEVIARSLEIACKKPLMYGPFTDIPVEATIEILRTTRQYHLFRSRFRIGAGSEHSGETLLLYCKPGTEGFSYL